MDNFIIRKKLEILHSEKIISHADKIWGYKSKIGRYRLVRKFNMFKKLLDLDKDDTVLEIGTGTGEYSNLLKDYCKKVVTFDISYKMAALAKSKINSLSNNVFFLVAAAEELPFKKGAFQKIVGNSVLHHLNLDLFISQLKEGCPNGQICFAEPNMLNPIIALERNCPYFRNKLYTSPKETAFIRWKLKKYLIKRDVKNVIVKPIDFLHPQTPDYLYKFAIITNFLIEKLFFLKEICGNLLIYGRL